MRSNPSISYVALFEGGWRDSVAAVHETRPTGLPTPRLLDRVCAALRIRHYSRRTEEAYVAWIRRYILFHGKRHPVEMGAPEVFLASRLLLVEGDTEKLSLPEYANRLSLDLDRQGATIVEVGGKRSLLEFAKVALSYGIPTGLRYDEDSSDFGEKHSDEAAFNVKLDSLPRADGSVRLWRLTKKYEDCVRTALGETKYQELCQKFGNTGRRAHRFAQQLCRPRDPAWSRSGGSLTTCSGSRTAGRFLYPRPTLRSMPDRGTRPLALGG